MSFDKFDVKELRSIAEEEFAVALSDDERKTKKGVLAALAASGVTFDMWLANHPDRVEEFQPTQADNVITSADVTGGTKEVKIITKEREPKAEPQGQYLVKMERENPLYEIGRYRFTSTHPFVLVDGADLKKVLTENSGFRQAYPDEVQDFYDAQ